MDAAATNARAWPVSAALAAAMRLRSQADSTVCCADQQRKDGPAHSLPVLFRVYTIWVYVVCAPVTCSPVVAHTRRCCVSPLLAQAFPDTASYPHLALAVSLLRQPAVMSLLLGHDDFTAVLEGLLTRKSPSPKDLEVRPALLQLPGVVACVVLRRSRVT